MLQNEFYFKGLQAQIDWFSREYGTPYKKKDGEISYSIGRAEFNKTFKLMNAVDASHGTSLIYESLSKDKRFNPDGLVARVIYDYTFNDSKKEKLLPFKETIDRYENVAYELLNTDYIFTLSDLSKILNLENVYANKFTENIDYIKLPAFLRHRLSPSGRDDFYRQKLFFSKKSLYKFIEDVYLIEKDMISVNISGSIINELKLLLRKNQKLDSIAQDIVNSNENFVSLEEKKKLKEEEINKIINVVFDYSKSNEDDIYTRKNMKIIGVHEKVSILDRKDDIRKELERIKNQKRENGKFAKVGDGAIEDSLIYVSYKKIPLMLELENGTKRHIVNYIRNSKDNIYFIANRDETGKVNITEGFEADTTNLNVSIPRNKVSVENIHNILKLIRKSFSEKGVM